MAVVLVARLVSQAMPPTSSPQTYRSCRLPFLWAKTCFFRSYDALPPQQQQQQQRNAIRFKAAIMADEALTSEQVAEMRKKRTFRKFTFRGVDLDKLLDLSMEVGSPVRFHLSLKLMLCWTLILLIYNKYLVTPQVLIRPKSLLGILLYIEGSMII